MEEYMFNALFQTKNPYPLYIKNYYQKNYQPLKKNGQKASQVLYKQVDLNQQEI